ncbi:MAG: spermidine/putrescine ABC transporter ATP-binding protein [Dictyoglomus sp. NZ13-RE01]|nr:MAG: spermidine/putrescine ABC transporter ATP-binding protein [Dictyoglomus sp. NZ13-RE01]
MKDFKEIRIENLNKSFGNHKVLQDFNLTIKKGEFVTLLGPSGCGKSTTLHCLAGLVPIDSGRIYIDDVCIDDGKNSIPPEKRGFGLVFQNYALFPHLNVFNNIAFGLQIKRMPKDVIKERVSSALKMVHLEGYENKYPRQLSGGEQQRVAIARCIVMEPLLMMLDEPLSNLDAKLRIEMRYELKALHEKLHITSIYVTHDQQEALALSDRIVVMRGGKIQQIGTPEEVYHQPSNLFVADFMGFRNMWDATVIRVNSNDEVVIKVLDFELLVRSSLNRKVNLSEIINRKVITAIRPEDIQIVEKDFNSIRCTTEVVEYLGQVKHVGASINGIRVDIRTQEYVKDKETIPIWIPPEKILLFSEEGERVL